MTPDRPVDGPSGPRRSPVVVRVLLVDDQSIVGESLRRTFAGHEDIRMQHCLDPAAAMEAAAALRPTVILLDLLMPVIDGLTLLSFLRASEATRRVPIIVLSSKEEPAIKAEAFALGASDYMVKLPDDLEILARVRHHSAGYVAALERDAAEAALMANHEVLTRLNEELQVRNRFIQQTFGRYLNDDVVDELLHEPKGLELGGENRVVTIMLSDLRGFTATCESLEAEQVVRLLNVHLGAMADVIARHGGTIDEFLGDSILAIFGAPVAREDDAERAIACAVAMQREMGRVNMELAATGLPVVEMGIGLNTGRVVVGNIGSLRRTKYGVVGSHVNLTARIESSTVGGQILVSERTLEEAGESQVVLGESVMVRAKGFAEPIVAHEVLGIRGRHEIHLEARDNDVVDLLAAVPVDVWPLDGKSVGDTALAGAITRLGRGVATIRCDGHVAMLADLKLGFPGSPGEAAGQAAYGKVTRAREGAADTFELRFTSVPEVVASMLDAARRPASDP